MEPLSCVYPDYEYGPCGCGAYFERHWVEVRTEVAGEPIVLSDLPQGVCPSCGSKVYKAEILELIEAIVGGRLPLSIGASVPSQS